jgi:DNA-binding CsgD family transcriptional regulator
MPDYSVKLSKVVGRGMSELAPVCAVLSPRETEVVLAIIDGETMKVTARRVGLSPRTIETHRLHALKKLRARTTGELVRIALRGE